MSYARMHQTRAGGGAAAAAAADAPAEEGAQRRQRRPTQTGGLPAARSVIEAAAWHSAPARVLEAADPLGARRRPQQQQQQQQMRLQRQPPQAEPQPAPRAPARGQTSPLVGARAPSPQSRPSSTLVTDQSDFGELLGEDEYQYGMATSRASTAGSSGGAARRTLFGGDSYAHAHASTSRLPSSHLLPPHALSAQGSFGATGSRPHSPMLDPLVSGGRHSALGDARLATMLKRAPSPLGAVGGAGGDLGVAAIGGQQAKEEATEQLLEQDSTVQVMVRVRPLSAAELARGECQAVFTEPDGRALEVEGRDVGSGTLGRTQSLDETQALAQTGGGNNRRMYKLRCLGPDCTQRELYATAGIKRMLRSALDGYSSTIFAYGQTGSGKTYSLSGTEELLASRENGGGTGSSTLRGYAASTKEREDDGVILRSLRALFDMMDADDSVRYSVRVCYLEIYQERCYDLLRDDVATNTTPAALEEVAPVALPVRWEKGRGFSVPAQTSVPCRTVVDALSVVRLGNQRRHVASHLLNADSSRSHSMLTVHIDSTPLNNAGGGGGAAGKRSAGATAPTRLGKVTFVDLAGSERLKSSKSSGVNQEETAAINRSLFTLGRVIATLGEPREPSGGTPGSVRGNDHRSDAHVPYRDSVLTKLLQDSLGGTSLALMLACVSPLRSHAEETISTLSYAMRAANITNTPTVQLDPNESLIQSLRKEIQLLRKENAVLRKQVGAGTQAAGGRQSAHGLHGDEPHARSQSPAGAHPARSLPPLPSTPPSDAGGAAEHRNGSSRGRARRRSDTASAASRFAEGGREGLGAPASSRGNARESLSAPHQQGVSATWQNERQEQQQMEPQKLQYASMSAADLLDPRNTGSELSDLLRAYALENSRLSTEVEELRGSKRLLELDHHGLAEENYRLGQRVERVEGIFGGLSADGGDGADVNSAAEIARLRNANEELRRKSERQKEETEEMKAMVRELLQATEEAQQYREQQRSRRAPPGVPSSANKSPRRSQELRRLRRSYSGAEDETQRRQNEARVSELDSGADDR